MNYTPEDLKRLCIKQSVFDGYSKKQVNEILEKIGEDYAKLIKENKEIKNKISTLNENLQHYKIIEEALQHATIVAQHTCEQIKNSANEKAKLINEEAEFNAKAMIETANQEVIKAKGKLEEIKAEIFTFKTKSEALLTAQLEVLKQLFTEQ